MEGYQRRRLPKITNNSPVVILFTLICLGALAAGMLTGGTSTRLLFSVYRSSMANPLTWLRFFTHVFGHADVEHLMGNLMLFLVVGPLLEEKYGSGRFLMVILVTALVTGAVSYFLFPRVQLMGASGVVFAMILLSSFTSLKEGEIPLTFILVAVLYLGQQIYQGVFSRDNVSQLSHIIGGAVGAVLGFGMNKKDNAGHSWQ